MLRKWNWLGSDYSLVPTAFKGFHALWYFNHFLQPGPEHGSLPPFRQSAPPCLVACSLCWSLIILLLLLYPLLAPLYPPVCYTLGHYHLVRLTGFGEGDCGAPAGGTPALKAPFCIARAARSLCYRWTHVPLLEKREIGTISESAWIRSRSRAFDLAGNWDAHLVRLCD